MAPSREVRGGFVSQENKPEVLSPLPLSRSASWTRCECGPGHWPVVALAVKVSGPLQNRVAVWCIWEHAEHWSRMVWVRIPAPPLSAGTDATRSRVRGYSMKAHTPPFSRMNILWRWASSQGLAKLDKGSSPPTSAPGCFRAGHSDRWGGHASLAQPVEAAGSNPAESQFESGETHATLGGVV